MSSGAWVLRLYAAGGSLLSARARRRLGAHLERLGRSDLVLEIIDVLEQPRRPLEDGDLVTPTLVRARPGPIVRIDAAVDLEDGATVLAALGLDGAPT